MSIMKQILYFQYVRSFTSENTRIRHYYLAWRVTVYIKICLDSWLEL